MKKKKKSSFKFYNEKEHNNSIINKIYILIKI